MAVANKCGPASGELWRSEPYSAVRQKAKTPRTNERWPGARLRGLVGSRRGWNREAFSRATVISRPSAKIRGRACEKPATSQVKPVRYSRAMRRVALALLAACTSPNATLAELPNLTLIAETNRELDRNDDASAPVSISVRLEYNAEAFRMAHGDACAVVDVDGTFNGASLEVVSHGSKDSDHDTCQASTRARDDRRARQLRCRTRCGQRRLARHHRGLRGGVAGCTRRYAALARRVALRFQRSSGSSLVASG